MRLGKLLPGSGNLHGVPQSPVGFLPPGSRQIPRATTPWSQSAGPGINHLLADLERDDPSLGSGPMAVIRTRAEVQLGTTQWPPRLAISCLWPKPVAGMRWIIWLADHPSKRTSEWWEPSAPPNPALTVVRMLWLEPPALCLVVGKIMAEGHGSSVATRFSDVTNLLAIPPFPGGSSKVGSGGRWVLVRRCLERLTVIPSVQGQTPLGPLLHVDLLVSAGTPTWVGLVGKSWKSPSFGFPRLCEIHTISLPWGRWLMVNEMTRLVQC